MYRNVKGNTFVYCLLMISNLCLLIFGIAIIAFGVYITIESRIFDYVTIAIMGIGLFICLVSLFACCARRSQGCINCYTFFVCVIFAAATATAVLITIPSTRDNFIAAALEHADPSNRQKIEDLLNASFDILIPAMYICLAGFVNLTRFGSYFYHAVIGAH